MTNKTQRFIGKVRNLGEAKMMLPSKAYSFLQKLHEHAPHGAAVSEVYMLHEVYRTEETPREMACAVGLERFTAWVESLSASCVGTPEKIQHTGNILLTFDDIFSSAFQNAIPVLQAKGLPYAVFIAPGLLGQPDYITPDELRVLAADPLCTIGAHSMRHGLMRPLSAEACRKEMTDSKHFLEDMLGREVADFAFPYGSVYACSRANIRQVSSCGFRRAFSTLNRSVTERDFAQPWFLPRRNVNDTVLKREGF